MNEGEYVHPAWKTVQDAVHKALSEVATASTALDESEGAKLHPGLARTVERTLNHVFLELEDIDDDLPPDPNQRNV